MTRFSFFLIAAFFIPALANAQECSPATEASSAILTSKLQDLNNRSRRAQARLDSQAFQVGDLTDEARQALSAPPQLPQMSETFFDSENTIAWTCDADGAPTPSVEEYEAALALYETDLTTFEAALRARSAEIAAALAAPAAPPQVAAGDADPEGPTDGGETEQEDPGAGGGTAEAEPDVLPGPGQGAAPDAGGSTETTNAQPLSDPDNPNLFRRVISLPNARLHTSMDMDSAAEPLPTFSVLYVFEEGNTGNADWLRVATSLREGDQGWVPNDQTLDWTSMLVMEFTRKGKRNDVLFFENDQALSDIVNSFSFATEAAELYSGIETERKRLASEPGTPPVWDQRLVAIEPPVAVTFTNDPYLLPILDWREELFDGTIETTLLQVAAVPADAASIQENDRANRGTNLEQAALNDGIFRVGVVFVVDTTVSMRPFIERTYQTIQSFYDSFQEMETANFVSFGLVGYRDSIANNANLDYVTRLFQPLDTEADARSVLTNMRQMRESDAPTIGFREDAFAGITDAIEQNDWAPYDARIIILVTDASARTGSDQLAKYPGNTVQSVADLAANNNTAILPIHLLTPANQRNGDAAAAADQYRALAASTGDQGNDKYIALDATDEDRFLSELKDATRAIASALLTINRGDVLDAELEEIPTEPSIASAITSEIFRAQLESLAVAADGSAPNFLAGWAADKDLSDPDLQALEVKVFLTRNQLSTLDKRLGDILDAFRSGGDDPTAFFENLQNLAAQTATDPDLVRGGMDDRAAMQAIMPAFLANLPYKSEILDLDREFWGSISVAQRSEFIERLDGKRKIYEQTFANTNIWQSFGADDPSLQATAVSLSTLP